MTSEFFQGQMQRLVNVFGGAYKTERAQIIWKEMSSLPEDAFERIVSKLIGEMRQAPMIQEFRDAASIERDKLWNKQKSQKLSLVPQNGYGSCQRCRDSGVVLARSKEDHSPWAFKCDCRSGNHDPRNYPLWHPSHEFEAI